MERGYGKEGTCRWRERGAYRMDKREPLISAITIPYRDVLQITAEITAAAAAATDASGEGKSRRKQQHMNTRRRKRRVVLKVILP